MTGLKVGDKVFLAHMGGWSTSYRIGTVVKITPKGLVDIDTGLATPRRFRADGKELGGSDRFPTFIDSMEYTERVAWLEQKKRAAIAANLICAVTANQEGKPLATWGKEYLQKEVDRLQELLDIARQAVEAI